MKIRLTVTKHLPLIIVLFIAAVLLAVNYTPVPFWDGTFYYEDFLDKYSKIIGPNKFGIHDFIDFKLGTHAGQSIILVAAVGQFIAGWKGVYIVQSLMILLSVFCLYRIIREMFPKMTESLSALAVAIYAFSPYIGSLGYEFGPYLYCSLYLIYTLYFYFVRKNYVLTGFFLLAVYLSLETGIIIVGLFIGTHIIYELVMCDGKSLSDRLKRVLPLKKLIPLLIPELILLIPGIWYYPGYSESTGSNVINNFGFNKESFMCHTRQTFVLNFFWVIWIILLVSVFLWNRKRIKTDFDKGGLISAVVSFTGYALFVCVCFISTPCPRYSQLVVFFYAIFMAVSLDLFSLMRIKRVDIVALVFSILLLIQNYFTIDPTYFGLYNIELNDSGSKVYSPNVIGGVLDVTTEYHNELYAYNLQSAYGVYLLDEILEYYDYNDDTFFLASFYIYYDVLGAGSLKWDSNNKSLVIGNDESYTEFKCVEYEDMDTLDADKVLLILPYMLETNEYSKLRDEASVFGELVSRKEFTNLWGTYYVYEYSFANGAD